MQFFMIGDCQTTKKKKLKKKKTLRKEMLGISKISMCTCEHIFFYGQCMKKSSENILNIAFSIQGNYYTCWECQEVCDHRISILE